jgi:4-amino-4-deoxy-L-arabinose transferase-like glycosyltransferase
MLRCLSGAQCVRTEAFDMAFTLLYNPELAAQAGVMLRRISRRGQHPAAMPRAAQRHPETIINPVASSKSDQFPSTWLVWGLAIVFVLAGLGGPGILNNNEGLYAEIPREMLASHDWRHWVIPHLNGLPYMEKPPLLYWLTALSFAVFGVSEWSARLVPALSALSCVGTLIWFGKAVGRPRAARLGALIFITGLGVTIMSRLLMFDMLLTALITGAFCCSYRYLTEGRPAQLRWAMVWLALALLAKGILGLLLFPAVLAGFLISTLGVGPRFWRAVASLFRPDALLILVALVAPWHIAASLTEPIFAWFYFINEHVLRFLGRREPHDYYSGPWWYYLPRMMLYLFPWSVFLLGLLARPDATLSTQSATLRRFLLMAWLVPLLFFSISRAKANYYLVAVMPFAALHLALALENRGLERPSLRSWPGYAIGILGALLCVVASLRHDDPHTPVQFLHISQKLLFIMVFAGIALLGVICALLARHTRVGLRAYLALPVALGCLTYALLMAVQPLVSAKEVALWLKQDAPEREVYLYRNFEEISSLPFYLQRPLPIIDPRSSDLYWGNRLRANRLMQSDEQFSERLKQGGKIAIVVMDAQLADFRSRPYAAGLHQGRRSGQLTVFMN